MSATLYWDADGRVACEKHAPEEGSQGFSKGGWRKVRRALARHLACDRCQAASTQAPSTRRSRRPPAPAGGPALVARVVPEVGDDTGTVIAVAFGARAGVTCDFCGGVADRMLIDDPEQLPPSFPADPIAARAGCAGCDDGKWSRVYPIEASTREEARTSARKRRRREMRGVEWTGPALVAPACVEAA